VKKDWMQIVTLLLCVILLGVTISQGKRLGACQNQFQDRMDRLEQSVDDKIDSISDRIRQELDESNRMIKEYSLEPLGINKEKKVLQAILSVTLKQWHEDTEVTMLVKLGEKAHSVSLTAEENGVFSGGLELPLEENCEIILDAAISGGGMTFLESVGGWGDISMLLPLHSDGGGWSGPEYRDGTMRSQFNIMIEGQNGKPGVVDDPHFKIYKNGELAQTFSAVEDPYFASDGTAAYTVDTENYYWRIDCEPLDVIEIRFLCRDEYGLGYDFLFAVWSAEGLTQEDMAGSGAQYGTYPLKLFWDD